MNSFILHFRPWLLALVGLAAIELAYYATARPPREAWNSFLDFQFTQEETFQRLVAYKKILSTGDADPDIIQVGDSSGLHGVQPPVVMSEIPGYNYLNLSVATNLGFSGYYNMARLQLQRSPNARYLVLYTSPLGGVPRKILWDEDQKLMARLIQNEFISPLHRLVQLPTLAARRDVVDYVYYMGYRFKQRNAPLSSNRGYLAFLSVFRENNGWTRETDVEGDVPTNIYKGILPGFDLNKAVDPNVMRSALRRLPKVTDEQFFNWRTLSRTSYFDHIYDAFAELAQAHGVKLVIIFNPLPESVRRPEFEELMDWAAIEAGLNRLRQRRQEVIVTNFEYWPDNKFSVFSHIETPSSNESSHRVGRILKEVIGDKRPASRSEPKPAPFGPRLVDIDFTKPYAGYGWTEQAGTTNRFPLQYVGPRNKAWIYASFGAGSPYTVRAVFRGDVPELAQRLLLKANDMPMRRLADGRDGDDLWAEWLVPEEVVGKYRGWMTLEFDLTAALRGTDSGKRIVSFKRVTATPQGQLSR